MFYIDKIPLKEHIITGLVAAVVNALIYAGLFYLLDDKTVDWSACMFFGIAIGFYFALALKWRQKTGHQQYTNNIKKNK